MNWFWVAYYVGAVITFRRSVLYLETQRVRRNEFRRTMVSRWYKEAETPALVPLIMGWPIIAVAYISWKLAFPRGVKTKAARQREREDRQRKLDEEKARQQRRDEELYRQAAAVLREYVVEQDAIAAAVPPTLRNWNFDRTDDEVLDRSVAETCFAEACEQVWRERGKPWHIGALTSIRVRAKVATKR